jgi:hypothetical protein
VEFGGAIPLVDGDLVSHYKTNANLSRQHTMYGKADKLVAFRLIPMEPAIPEVRSQLVVLGGRL